MARLPPSLRGTRPAEARWSPLEVVEHLALTDGRFTRTLGEKIRAAVAAGLAPESGGREALPAPISARVADRTAPRSAPDDLHPSGTLDERATWELADTARARLRDSVLQGDSLALSAVVHEHPAFGALTVYQWVEFIAAHELRHVEQIRESHGIPT